MMHKTAGIKNTAGFGIVILDKGIPIYQVFANNPIDVMKRAVGFVIKKYQLS
jgi:hypothetical protein